MIKAFVESIFEKNDYPISDYIDLIKSPFTFPKGANYGVEIPVINNLKSLELIIKLLREEGVPCSRFNETHGSFLLSDSELSEMLSLCSEENYGITVGLGPRPEYDIKASFYRSNFGLEQCRSVNNNSAIFYSIKEAIRLVKLGVTGIIVYDMGVLKILSKLRYDGHIPKNVMFKTSSHLMACNYVKFEILNSLGADSITTTHDLDLPVLQSMRKIAPNCVIDIPVDVYKNKGGYIRFNELYDIVKVSSPVFLKMGASAQKDPYDSIDEKTILKRVKRVQVGLECFKKSDVYNEFSFLSKESGFNCIPIVDQAKVV